MRGFASAGPGSKLLLGGLTALACGALAAAAARADVNLGGATLSGNAQLGVRSITGDWGSGKFEEYRWLHPGVFGSGSFLLEDEARRHFFRGWLEDVGEGDQHYEAEAGRWGAYRLELEYDELPHVFSNAASTLYRTNGNARLSLPAGLQASLQALAPPPNTPAAAQSAALGAALDAARSKSLEQQLRSGRVGLAFEPTEDLSLHAGYRIQDKQGTRRFGMGFGSPGNNFVNVAAPIDERIHEVTSGMGFARPGWSVGVDYIGSFFENRLHAITVANPLRATDSATAGSSLGRSSVAPDNSAHTVRLEGASVLPLDFPARVAGTLSYGVRLQNEDFIAHTINSALAGLVTPLGDDSLDGEVRTLLGNLVLTGRPAPKLDLALRYRIYDYDNRTPVVTIPDHVVNDRTRVDEERFTVPNEYTRQNAKLDGSYRLTRATKLLLGYAWEQWERSNDRERTLLYEHGGKLGLDLRPADWALLRATYKFGIRRGNDYRGFARVSHTVTEEEQDAAQDQGQLPQLRKFDQADRIRNETALLAQLNPREDLTLSLSGGYRQDNYDGTEFGLTGSRSWNVGTDASYRLSERLGLSGYYSFEDIRSWQRSRWRPRTTSGTIVVVDDPLNNWKSRSADDIHNVGVTFDAVLIPERLDASVGYGIQAAVARTRAQNRPGFVAASGTVDGGNAFDYPNIEDVLQTLSFSLRYHLREDLTLESEYRFERFDLHNFKTESLDPFEPNSNVNGSGTVSPSTDVFLGERVEDYNAHVLAFSVTYRF